VLTTTLRLLSIFLVESRPVFSFVYIKLTKVCNSFLCDRLRFAIQNKNLEIELFIITILNSGYKCTLADSELH